MSAYQVQLANVMRLQGVLEKGGTAVCAIHREADWATATVTVEFDQDTAKLQVEFKSLTRTLKLQRGDSANCLHIRDFIQDLVDDQARATVKALALMEAHTYLTGALPDGHIGYITPTPWPATPFAAVVTNNIGEMCAVASGATKEDLVAKVRTKLGLATQGHGETA